MDVYTKIEGKLAKFDYGALYNDQYMEAINAVRKTLSKKHRTAIVAVLIKEPVQYELQLT